jgi:hypothetical protein
MALSALAIMLIGTACGSITELLSPGFTVTNISVTPETADVGDEVTITVTLKNDGDGEGICYVPLLINGEPADVDSITLAAGAEGTVTFTTTKNYGGTYEIDVLGETATLTITPSDMQNILKMVPASWNAFIYFGAEAMRTDATPDPGLGGIYYLGEDYLEAISGEMGIDVEDWPFTMAELNYMALGVGGLEGMGGDTAPNMTAMISVDTPAAEISTFLNDFHTNFDDAGIQFTSSGTDTWLVDIIDAGATDPGVTVALITSGTSRVILIGPTADVTACKTVINDAGDADSMFENASVKTVVADFGNPIIMGIINGNVPIPSEEGGDGPDLPATLDATIGFAMGKVGDSLKMEGIFEIGSVSDWIDVLLAVMPAPEDLFGE